MGEADKALVDGGEPGIWKLAIGPSMPSDLTMRIRRQQHHGQRNARFRV
jgi:hypothetical protein